jgi:hypothetical protein
MEGLGKLKKFVRLIGSRIRDHPVCTIVPQPLRYCVPAFPGYWTIKTLIYFATHKTRLAYAYIQVAGENLSSVPQAGLLYRHSPGDMSPAHISVWKSCLYGREGEECGCLLGRGAE